MPTRRRNPATTLTATAVTALANARDLLAEAEKLSDAAAKEAMKAVTFLDREPLSGTVRRSSNFIVHGAIDDSLAVYEAAMAAGTYARRGASGTQNAMHSLVMAAEDAGVE